MLDYEESSQEAASLVRQVLQMLGKYDIPANPRNFALFYEYALARNPALNRALDLHLSQHGGLTSQASISLYDEFIAQGSFVGMRNSQEELKRILRSVMLQLLQTGNEFAQYASGLGAHIEALDGKDIDIESLREMASLIINDTRQMEASARSSSSRLIGASHEVDRLRKELEQARREANTDPLTGLLNRRAFTVILEQAITKSDSVGERFSLIMMDIDHFKNINDSYGHWVGDKVLRYVGRMLPQLLKGQDSLCRLGGEEFVILLPSTSLEDAMRVAESIRTRMVNSQLRLSESRQPLGEITASFSVAAHRVGETMDELLQRVDRALYEAKSSGRNRVHKAPDSLF